jgi:hypothetical protein
MIIMRKVSIVTFVAFFTMDVHLLSMEQNRRPLNVQTVQADDSIQALRLNQEVRDDIREDAVIDFVNSWPMRILCCRLLPIRKSDLSSNYYRCDTAENVFRTIDHVVCCPTRSLLTCIFCVPCCVDHYLKRRNYNVFLAPHVEYAPQTIVMDRGESLASIKIQATVRGFLARQKFKKMKTTENE